MLLIFTVSCKCIVIHFMLKKIIITLLFVSHGFTFKKKKNIYIYIYQHSSQLEKVMHIRILLLMLQMTKYHIILYYRTYGSAKDICIIFDWLFQISYSDSASPAFLLEILMMRLNISMCVPFTFKNNQFKVFIQFTADGSKAFLN